jgi:hypothetical protein
MLCFPSGMVIKLWRTLTSLGILILLSIATKLVAVFHSPGRSFVRIPHYYT